MFLNGRFVVGLLLVCGMSKW